MKKLILLLILISFSVQAQRAETATSENPIIQDVIQEFHWTARQYRIEVIDKVDNLETIVLIDSHLNFFAEVSEDGKKMMVNAELLKYKHLLRVIILREYGEIYELKKGEFGHDIMGEHWEIDQDHEDYAELARKRNGRQTARFFETLQDKFEIKKQL